MGECRICGDEFKKHRNKANKYCSIDCYRVAQKRGDYTHARVEPKVCEWCGGEFYPKQGAQKFCDRECYLGRHTRKVEWDCAYCGETQVTSPGTANGRKYCSHECRVEHKRPDAEVDCIVCGVAFCGIHIQNGYVKVRSTRRVCSDECHHEFYRTDEDRKQKISLAFSGERHWNWQGGKSRLNTRYFRGAGWDDIAAKVRKRDDYECQECGATREDQGGRRLSVHHIVPFHNFESVWKANRRKNLTTLCQSCHKAAEHQVEVKQMVIPLYEACA